MKTKSVPLQRAASLGGGVRRSPSAGKPAPRRLLLARRVTSGLLRRMPSFARSVTDSDASEEEDRRDGPPSAVGGPEPLASPSDGDGVAGDALAREVGRNALEYLEECFDEFDDGSSVLDREAFDALPEVVPEALAIEDHIGMGSYCDVFDVVYKGSPRARLETGETYALKRLRPQLRSDAEKFTMGAEDLVHETAVLANLDHEHIIKLHGRAAGPLADAFAARGGYFLLLARLDETLHERLAAWKRAAGAARGPRADRLAVARDAADALGYLHSRDVLFRDLKPENVGFDGRGVLKLFDFGFAIGRPATGLLYDRCGTPRYMAPEVGLSRGYGAAADVYSFGVLLWELCALETPFAAITQHEEFERAVFRGGRRPALGERWSAEIRALIAGCWAAAPDDRPTMAAVEASLAGQCLGAPAEIWIRDEETQDLRRLQQLA